MAKTTYSNRELMLLAIEQMNENINEPRPDGKVPPKVGAVILFPDGRIEKSYRGELREGDHAEFTLLERKLGNSNLEGCILFTTLEPCVERNTPKVPCCRRTSNARIKKVFVGIEDKDPTVDGKGIKHLQNAGIEVKIFDRDLQRIIEKENKHFLEQALERKKETEKEDLRIDLERAVPTFDISKLSEDALNKFILEANLDHHASDIDFHKYLADFGALEFDRKSGIFRPTGFGILLFGKNPRAKYPQAVLKAQIDYGAGKVEPMDFDGPLVMVPDRIEGWLRKVLPHSKNTSSFKRRDVPDFPIEVLREAIINALVHRDYEIPSAKCELKITADTVTINSPGAPLPAISIEELNSFEASSLSRNPILTYVFNKMKYVEEKGFGMDTFRDIEMDYGLPIPRYVYKAPFLTLKFERTTKGLENLIDNKAIKGLNADDLNVFEIIRSRGPISKSSIVEMVNLTPRTTERLLKKLVDKSLIMVEGSGRSTKYRLND